MPDTRRYVIIGNGIAGTGCAETLRKLDPTCQITLLAEEPYPLYNRVSLPPFLKLQAPESKVLMRTRERHEQMRTQPEFSGKTAPKRPLGEFETAALAKLRDGDDVVLQASSQEMRVLGAIRARNECLSCHKSAEVGTLLGAFTYTLHRQSEETPEADRLIESVGRTWRQP